MTNSQALPAFNAISLCMPVNLYVVPNTTANADHSITIQAEPQVANATSYRVSQGTLFLESAGNFSTFRPIKVTVSLPANALQRIDHFGTGVL